MTECPRIARLELFENRRLRTTLPSSKNHDYRYRTAVDYSTRAGLLEPVRSGDWVESVDASARVQIATKGWFRHTNRETDRILLSCPEFDTPWSSSYLGECAPFSAS